MMLSWIFFGEKVKELALKMILPALFSVLSKVRVSGEELCPENFSSPGSEESGTSLDLFCRSKADDMV